jgi:lysophospholipase L1-like esterase
MNDFLNTLGNYGAILLQTFIDQLYEVSSGSPSQVTLVSLLLELILFAFSLRILYSIFLFVDYSLRHSVVAVKAFRKPYIALRPGGKRVLIVGDSTAFGMGADRPEDSIAGRLARDFPNAEILNYAVNGSLSGNVLTQLNKANGETFDLILIFTGGNDLWHLTPAGRVRKNLTAALQEANKMSNNHALVLYYANIATAPLFPALVRRFLTWRNERIHGVFIEVCSGLDVPCIELFTPFRNDLHTDPFEKNPRLYFSLDMVHPSSEGYRVWYNHMWREMNERNFLFRDKTQAFISDAPNIKQ